MTAISRRTFLFGSLATGAAAGAVALTAERHPLLRLLGQRDDNLLADGERVLVVVTLYGGNDGLNTVIPVADGRYQQGRGSLAYRPNETIAVGQGLAFHPSLKGMKKLWDDKRLAIIRGVGYPQPDHSHFRSMDIWQSGVPGSASSTGWLGRWLDGAGGDPLKAVSVGTNVPRLLVGERRSATAVPSAAFTVPGGDRVVRAFASLQNPADQPSDLAAAVAQSGADLLTASAEVTKAVGPQKGGAATPSQPAQTGAGGELATELSLVSTLIRARVPARVYSVSLPGFDTHADEKATQARLLGQLDAALTGFLDGLAKVPHAGGVTVLVYSEFGRRVAANASGGTDHGTAAPAFVAGPAVRGGFYGEEPSLANLDNGDLRATTDFRSVYATVLEKVLHVAAAEVIPGGRFPTLPFL